MKYRPLVPWQVLDRQTLLERPWLTLYEDRIRLPNGRDMPEFHVLDAPSWASVLCVARTGEVLFVRQYRHGMGGVSLELPAGVIENGEDAMVGARRELAEETGYTAERWEPLLTVSTDPSRQTVRAHFFLALDATPNVARSLDESEDIEVVRVPQQELFGLIAGGAIVHGVHVGAILFAAKLGHITI